MEGEVRGGDCPREMALKGWRKGHVALTAACQWRAITKLLGVRAGRPLSGPPFLSMRSCLSPPQPGNRLLDQRSSLLPSLYELVPVLQLVQQEENA